MDILEGPSIPEFERCIVNDPMESMDPLDPPPCYPPTKKRPICLHDTLQDVERHIPSRKNFREVIICAGTDAPSWCNLSQLV